MPNELILRAPLSGVIYPLERVPDPVFAQKLMGDGLAIDPIDGTLRAPCAGEIVQLHPAAHALTLRTPEGVEVLLHIGIDTVTLKGAGFTPRVRHGRSRCSQARRSSTSTSTGSPRQRKACSTEVIIMQW